MKSLSIRAKVVGLVLLGVCFVTAMVGISVVRAFERNKQTLAKQSLAGAQAAFKGLIDDDIAKLGATGEALLASNTLVQAFVERDRARLLKETQRTYPRLLKDFGVTHFNFISPDRKIFLRMTKPQQFDDLVDRVTLLNAIQTQKLSAGLELGKTGFVLRTVRPIQTEAGTVGYLELGEEIGQFSSRLKNRTGFELGILLIKSQLNKDDWTKTRSALGLRDNWNDRADVVVAQTTTSNEEILNYGSALASIPSEGKVLEQVGTRASMHMRGIFPIADASGKAVGAVFILTEITALNNAVVTAQLQALSVTLVLGAILALAVWIVLDRLVFRRLAVMAERLEQMSLRVAGGDFDIDTDAETDARDDEIGKLEQFLGQFLKLIGSTLKSLCGAGP